MLDTYTCESCHQTFTKGWSDEEAKAESLRTFGALPAEDVACVCDDCHAQIMEYVASSARGQLAARLEKLALETEGQHMLTLALTVRSGQYSLDLVPALFTEAAGKDIAESVVKKFFADIDWNKRPLSPWPPCVFNRRGRLFKKRLLMKKLQEWERREENNDKTAKR